MRAPDNFLGISGPLIWFWTRDKGLHRKVIKQMVQFLNYNIYLTHFRNQLFLSGPFCPLSMPPTLGEYICLQTRLFRTILASEPSWSCTACRFWDRSVHMCLRSVKKLASGALEAAIDTGIRWQQQILGWYTSRLKLLFFKAPLYKNHGVEDKCVLSKCFQTSKVLI